MQKLKEKKLVYFIAISEFCSKVVANKYSGEQKIFSTVKEN